MQDVRAAHRRNGAFHCWLDEWLEFIASTWAKHLRQGMRNDCRLKEITGCGLGPAHRRLGTGRPPYLATRRSVRLHGYGFFGRTFGDTSNWSRPGLAPCNVIHGSVTDSLSDSCGGRNSRMRSAILDDGCADPTPLSKMHLLERISSW